MARRDLSNYNTVTQVLPEGPSLFESLARPAAEIGQQIIRQSQEAKIVENMSAAQLELGKLSNDFQTKYEGDPFNEDGIKDFRDQRQGILDKYGEDISPLFRRNWQENATRLTGQNDIQVQAWGYKQSAVNTKQSLSTAMQNHLTQAAKDGESFGNSDATEIDSFLSFAQAKEKLDEFGNAHLGETSTQAITKDFEQDYAKVFISGVAHSNPVKALKMMDNPVVRDTFTDPAEFAKFRDAVETRALNVGEVMKQQEVLNVLKTENALFSSGKALSYAEIQQTTQGMSEEAKKYFMKVNGYSKENQDGHAWKQDEQLQAKATIYDQITQISQSENISSENIQSLQGDIYKAMRKGALTEAEGASFLTQLIDPAVTQKEAQMSKFSSGQWNPWKDNVGFKELKNFYEDSVAIQPAGGEDKVGKTSGAINAMNKANLYDNYWNSLQTQAAKRNIAVADIENSPDRDAIYAKAQQDAEMLYRAKSSPVLKIQPSIPITAIKRLLEHPEKAGDFDDMFGTGAANRILGK